MVKLASMLLLSILGRVDTPNKSTMSNVSEKQIEANRLNGLKGGPKTDEGKAVVAKNALKHGIFAKEVVVNAGLIQESEEELNGLKDSFFDIFKPCNKAEEELVQNIVFNIWRKRRLARAEAGEIKKENAYLAELEDAEQKHANSIRRSASRLIGQKESFEDKLNDLDEIQKFIVALESALHEYEATGYLPAESIEKLLALFGEEYELSVAIYQTKSISTEPTKGMLLKLLGKHLSRFKDRQKYLLVRNQDQKINKSAANYVPNASTVERLLKYGVSIDNQIKSSISLLSLLRSTNQKEEQNFNL